MPLKGLFICLALCLSALFGCAERFGELREEGLAIIVYPAAGGGMVWQLDGEGAPLEAKGRDIGGSYRAVALKPGVYRAVGAYNVLPRGRFGSGDKDLDYGERAKARGERLAEAARLPLALVKRLPVKEEYDLTDGNTGVRAIPSEYRVRLATEPLASFEARPGEVLLLPALRASVRLDEKSCLRYGRSAGKYNVYYENPDMHYLLSPNPDDLAIVEWACPVRELEVEILPPSLEKARANAEGLEDGLRQKLKPGRLELAPWLAGAAGPGGVCRVSGP